MVDIGFGIPVGGAGLAEIAVYIWVAFIIGLPTIFAILVIRERNIIAYLAAIIGYGVATPVVEDNIGYLLPFMIVVIIGLGVKMLKDAWTTGLRL